MHHQYQAHFWKQWFDKETTQRSKRENGMNFGNGKTRITAGTDYNGLTTSPTHRDFSILTERYAERDRLNLARASAANVASPPATPSHDPYSRRKLFEATKSAPRYHGNQGLPLPTASEHYLRAQNISAAIREETMKAASRQSAKSLEGYQPHQEHHYPFGWSKGTSASPTRSISPKRQWGNAISFCERISPVQSSVKGRPQNELEARVARLERSGLFSSRRSTPQLM